MIHYSTDDGVRAHTHKKKGNSYLDGALLCFMLYTMVAVSAMLENLKVLLAVRQKAPVKSIEMNFAVRIKKALSLKVGKDCVEEINHLKVSRESLYSDGEKGKSHIVIQ